MSELKSKERRREERRESRKGRGKESFKIIYPTFLCVRLIVLQNHWFEPHRIAANQPFVDPQKRQFHVAHQ